MIPGRRRFHKLRNDMRKWLMGSNGKWENLKACHVTNESISIYEIMSHYFYTKKLKELWEKAREVYNKGNREPYSYFNEEETAFLDSIGMTAQELFDFLDDEVRYDMGDYYTSMMLIQDVRRSYFLEEMKGKKAENKVDVDKLPAKGDEIEGIRWLPRMIAKGKAKLKGEMPDELMYGCAGDRKFFEENNVHPAEFLRMVWESEGDDQMIVDWVVERRKELHDEQSSNSLMGKVRKFLKS